MILYVTTTRFYLSFSSLRGNWSGWYLFFFFFGFHGGYLLRFFTRWGGQKLAWKSGYFFWMAGTLSFLYVICSGTQIVSWFFDPAWGLGYVLSR